jgi:hypothetical protein
MTWLKRHPFPVLAWFERVVAVSFAFPEEVLRPLVPAGLEIDAYEGLGFVTVAMVWTKHLRPSGFPEMLGQNFFLAGYRVFTKLHDESGRRLRGLKILHSETDKRSMTVLGNVMTGYNYRQVRVGITETNDLIEVRTTLPDGNNSLRLGFDPNPGDIGPPAGSPFPDWRTARRFAGPMPFTFCPQGDGSFVVVEGSRASWTPRPVEVVHCDVALFNEPPFAGTTPILANAFMVENIDYRWEKGRIIRPPSP